MNKYLSLAYMLLLAISANSMSYTIAFYRSALDSAIVSVNMINSTDNCVIGSIYEDNISRGPEGFGIKGGTTKLKGAISLQLDTIYHITGMSVYAASYKQSSDTASTKGIIICGDTLKWETGHRTEIRQYVVNVDTLVTDSITISSIVDKNNRWYIQKIEFTADDPRPNRPKITAPLSHEFETAKIEDGQPAEDISDISIAARNCTDSLRLRLKKGTDFHLESPVLAPTGGTITISYKVSTGGTKKDVLYIKAIGNDSATVEYEIPIKMYAVLYTPPEDPVDSTKMHFGAMPHDYYKPAQGKSDSLLKDALSQIINCGARYRYGSGKKHTWEGFFYTDRDTLTNQVLDMYSNDKCYFDTTNPSASVANFDIEHMLPKSWWGGDVNYAYRDLFHLVPANYSANRSKSNHAPGIPADSTFNNGSFVTGSGKAYGLDRVFCPTDEYKGDFARAYFYIVTCYDTLHWVETGDAAIAMTNVSYLEFRPWLQELLMKWHRADPVSQKEKDRAIAVNRIQGNRNPFIDFPELAEYIWGNKQGENVDFYKLTQSFGDPYDESSAIVNISFPQNKHIQKMIVDDHMYIYYNGEYYSLLGQ